MSQLLSSQLAVGERKTWCISRGSGQGRPLRNEGLEIGAKGYLGLLIAIYENKVRLCP